ncbi:MAG: alpha-amylase family glycosyl hydrolase [bacterium]|nr:alpha-amylase family glycosyl hydrolase [bacterium]
MNNSFKSEKHKNRWPEGAIVYHIYPRSFYDSNADGIGDIPGITAKLKHLKSIGVNAIWLSPFYPSPMADFGYDIADYCDVDPIFGTLKDMDKLIRAAHGRKIKVIVDLVPNHSSSENEWFKQSRQSENNKYSDWYVWKDPKALDKSGNPIAPNNWLDIFSGKSAWEWEPARQQFYLHSFDVKQPELNWANPEVRDAIKDAMRFWLKRGVDGFRVDAVRFMGKDPMFKDNPKNPGYKKGRDSDYSALKHVNSQGWPQLYAYLNEMSSVLKEKPFHKKLRFMVTESYPETHETVEEYLAFYEGMDPEVAAPFNFEGLSLPWHAEPWRKFLGKFHKALDDYNSLCISSYAFGNHDQWRLATRMGEPAARSAAVLLLTLPGMAFIYNGEEIGMQNGEIPPHLVQDPGAEDSAGRDPERTPMQWSSDSNAGFSEADSTWLPVASDYKERNVAMQTNDKDSFLSLYKSLGNIRNKSDTLKKGNLEIIDTGTEDILGFTRSYKNKKHLVLINFSKHENNAVLPSTLKVRKIELSSLGFIKPKKHKSQEIILQSNEALVLSVK